MKSHLIKLTSTRVTCNRASIRHWPLVALLLLSAVGRQIFSRELSAGTPSPMQGGIFYTVNTTSDAVVAGACSNGNPGCSLRGAIQAANSHVGTDGIGFALPPGSVISLTGVLPDITESVSISGPGANLVTVRRNTGGNYRIFNVTVLSPGTVTFAGMTISNGFIADNGGGIQNVTGATVNVTNCIIQGNLASPRGGGISNNSSGTVNVSNCTISGNWAGDAGGGISNQRTGTVNVTNSTLSDNTAQEGGTGDTNGGGGGGISNGGDDFLFGLVNVTNCTISGNTAWHAGGIGNTGAGRLNVTNSTLSGNVSYLSTTGGAIGNYNGVVTVKGSIIALTTGTPTSMNRSDVSGPFTSSGFNLIGKTDGSTGFTAATDLTGTMASPLDPKLDPAGLQNNGGPTQTIGLLLQSPAIDKGTSAGLTGSLTSDQRGSGFRRTFDYPGITNAAGGDGTDIGAYELLAPFSVSRKTHNGPVFDVNLTLPAGPGVECRSGGMNGDHQVIVTFPAPVVSLTSASVTAGSGSVSSFSISGSQVVVSLTGVTNAQRIVLTLFGVSNGTTTNDVSVPMGILLGDTTGNGAVNASDIGLTKSTSGQAVGTSNFRTDVTVNGSTNASDVGLVKANAGTALP